MNELEGKTADFISTDYNNRHDLFRLVNRCSWYKVMRDLNYEQLKYHRNRFRKVVEIQPSEIGTYMPGDKPEESDLPF